MNLADGFNNGKKFNEITANNASKHQAEKYHGYIEQSTEQVFRTSVKYLGRERYYSSISRTNRSGEKKVAERFNTS